jgi:ABC-type branched-subunit amino acid transport system substrate-binding protein/predicted Ser/Thr protein kinase
VSHPSEPFPFLAPPQGPDEIGWLNHYRVLKLLGAGGMGIVFQAVDTHLQRPVALKVMRPEAARDPHARQRFLREARLTAAIRSEHIVTIHQVGEVAEVPFLAMELLPGETLASWLQRGGRPTPQQVIDLGLQVARGLDAAHSHGLVHRDIKPANIWLEAGSGRVKILDFGLARLTRDSGRLTHPGLVMGTPAYMAPEQADNATLDGRCDLFSLGCVLYEFAAGEPPFTGPSTFAILKATVLQDPKPLHEVCPTIPPALSALVVHLLAKDPADRPPSAAAVVAALQALGGPPPTPLQGISAAPKKPPILKRLRRRRWLAGLAGALVLALLLAGWFVFPLRHGSSPASPTAQGVSATEVRFGMSAPFFGPARELGQAMKVGILTCFQHVNDEGGIAGRKLRLVALDDGYEPDRALTNMRRLDEEYQVFGFVGNVGTPTAKAALPYALEQRQLFFGAFTGAQLLRRTPPDRYVFNFRASYEEETAAAVKYLIERRKVRPEQIAVFAQHDAFGNAGFRGAAKALRRYGRAEEQILRVDYERNTLVVEPAVAQIKRHQEVRAVVMVPTYRQAARFIQQLKDAGRDLIFTSVSFVNSEALAEELRQLGPRYPPGVIVTQVVPPVTSQSSAVLKYRELLRRYQSSERPGSVSLEGYLAASVLVEGLRRAGSELTTDTLIEALESIRDLDLGIGTLLRFSPSEHQASHKVWAIVLDEKGQFQPLDLD